MCIFPVQIDKASEAMLAAIEIQLQETLTAAFSMQCDSELAVEMMHVRSEKEVSSPYCACDHPPRGPRR